MVRCLNHKGLVGYETVPVKASCCMYVHVSTTWAMQTMFSNRMIEETEFIVTNFCTFPNVLTDTIWFYFAPVRRDILDDGQGFTLAEQADKCGFLHPVLYYYEKTDDLSESITVCYVQCHMISHWSIAFYRNDSAIILTIMWASCYMYIMSC